ncbi:tripartite tricarboxylate transporter substrate binding protein [Alkalihalophilus pseudofirmus]|uniref:Tripartite tricarboxylate transporter substrate binding protein n=1 Tax=Alkalihalophilus pseudofirmus TaxID=79885 RepID=A0AAJ2NNC1_ALKPS|nr:tripartite tricarboxylate transporter substrate binding protein [Alkalihalophilus pseudofirmus]MDV2885517.1 tripartite tricarboxylate transporter substrate binding protein [Alkalihalophilus pseudofirmus]
MKKNYFLKGLLAFSLASIVALAGCGESTSTSEQTNGGDTSESTLKYPTKPIRILNPFSAGGPADNTSRILARHAEELIGESIVIENRDGGGGTIGQTAGASANPDGYTLTLITSSIVSNPIFNEVSYTHDSFEPVIMTVNDPFFLVVSKDAPFDDIDSFLEYAKENPGKINVGVSGSQTVPAFTAKELEEKAEIELTTVPFDGEALAVAAAAGGHIDALIGNFSGVESQINSGTLKPILLFDDESSDLAPDVPLSEEAEIDLISGSWRGIAVPAGTDPEIIEFLHDTFKETTEKQEYQDQLINSGIGITYRSPEEFKEVIEDTYNKYMNYAE